MATKPKQAKPAKRDPATLHLEGVTFKDAEERGAVIASSPVIRGAVTGRKYAESMFGAGLDLTAYATQLREQADKVKAGDLSAVETMLVAQANTLDMIFNQLARKAAHSEYLNQMEAHLRHALRAQAQCRATLETLAEIKNPRPVAFVKQANITNGPQQVNNGVQPPNTPHTRAHEESGNQSNELLEHQHGKWLDAGAARQTGRSNQALEAVEQGVRAEERRG
ncbi:MULTISPECIES: hypothetical protein [Ralstonia]|jgi:hypothetical protein|uniref:Uncharacterized protein n=1 Tax=Ralstonia pickettii OR214 TaxID=1264675 RepID=R0E926_RALPI|nr:MULTISPECIES: hypothetical protein [Ralstonia]MEA3270087.1 hypothetical protein [Pseudomonadota bacterium]ENZ78609.1 hypothetical protein OR214_01122 [Ralstonia pickettii OR214]MBL4780193.1 hypothetical protein [Ralstonia sp.]MCM3581520.1 hypothetical protein [Ralstonia pickettii]MDR9386131.1 hypothetical protein [Ralstonia sp. 11b]